MAAEHESGRLMFCRDQALCEQSSKTRCMLGLWGLISWMQPFHHVPNRFFFLHVLPSITETDPQQRRATCAPWSALNQLWSSPWRIQAAALKVPIWTDSPVKTLVTPQCPGGRGKFDLVCVFSSVLPDRSQVFTRTARTRIKSANQRKVQVGRKKLQTAD